MTTPPQFDLPRNVRELLLRIMAFAIRDLHGRPSGIDSCLKEKNEMPQKWRSRGKLNFGRQIVKTERNREQQ
ncbi:MAG: hypothetical protein AB4290_15370 [Spirulina sp.]